MNPRTHHEILGLVAPFTRRMVEYALSTDGNTIFFGASFEQLACAVQVGLVAHEMLHIALREPQRQRELGSLVLSVGDDRVRRVEQFDPGRPALSEIGFNGGGGTDFTPLLEETDRHRPDIAVVLTDLDGPANFRPRWPVIWAVPEACANAAAPFGRKLTLS